MEPARIELDASFLRRIERLAIVARRTLRGLGQGERKSKRHGGAVEFSDYRGYSPGDDTRRIDWYAYARLESLVLKLYVEEQDLALHVLLDQSASMGAGSPPKLPWARQLAVAMAWIGLSAGDRVTVRAFRGGERAPSLGPLRGREGLTRLLAFLGDDSDAEGPTSLEQATRAFVGRRPPPGVVIIITDLLDPEWRGALRRLRAAGHEPHVIHVVAPDEAEPVIGADHDLRDAETGEVVSVALDRGAVKAYRAAWDAFAAEVVGGCAKDEVGYVQGRTDIPVEDFVLEALRRRAWVR